MTMTTDAAADEAARRIDSAISAARGMKDSVDGFTDDLFKTLNRSIKDQPLTTLAIAAGVGLVLGVVLKR